MNIYKIIYKLVIIVLGFSITLLVSYLITLFINYVVHLFRPDVTIKVWVTYIGIVIINLLTKINTKRRT